MAGLIRKGRHQQGHPQTSQRERDTETAKELIEADVQQQSTRKASQKETGEKIKADIDDLLDEIDEVLETNAEDFVRSYIQKGGE